MMNRGLFLGSSAAFASIAILPARAAAQVRIASLTSEVSAEPLFAQDQGFFTSAGLSAEIMTLANGGAIIGAVAAGAADIGFGNLASIAAARARGIPVKLVAPAAIYTSKAPVTTLMKVRGSALRTGPDLRGKTIAVSTLRGELQVGASAWIDKTGGDASQTRFIEMPFSEMAAALVAGRVDAAMLTEPAITINAKLIERLADAYNAIADTFLIGAFVASERWIGANPDAAKRFGDAMAQTAAWANTHRPQTAVMLAKNGKIAEATLRDMTRATYGERLSVDVIQPVLDAALKYGSLKVALSAKDLLA